MFKWGDQVKWAARSVTWDDGFSNKKGDLGLLIGRDKQNVDFSFLVSWKKDPEVIQNCSVDELEFV